MKKICFAASSGGHFEQMLMLKPIMDEYSSIVVTEKTQYSVSVSDKKMFYLHQVNRKEWTAPFWMFLNTLKSLQIVLNERPDVIISTGVLSMIPLCLFVKFFGGKLIYIESFAKVTTPTQTGKFLYKYADQFYVQWESMRKVYPKAIFLGGIY